jgi:hypothetical protein
MNTKLKRNLSNTLVTSLVAISLLALPTSANAAVHDASGGTVIIADSSDLTQSFSATVESHFSDGSFTDWQCWSTSPFVLISMAVGGVNTTTGGNGYYPQLTASISWSNQSVAITSVGQENMENRKTRWQFRVTDQNFIDSFDSGDAIELSLSGSDTATPRLSAVPDSGGMISNYSNHFVTSFSGLVLTNVNNKNSTSGCVQQAANNPAPPPSSQGSPSPAKYSGPEFSGLSGMGIMTGTTGKLEGERLDQISSIEIGGEAATFTATSATELELSLPTGLAPGLYDLVINSSAGKLTHMNAIQVREPKKSFSITTRSTGKISNDQYIEHSLIASMQIPELNKARCVVNANSIAMARAMANRLCAVVKASNPNIETTIVETRSTVKGDAVYARVSYGWN